MTLLISSELTPKKAEFFSTNFKACSEGICCANPDIEKKKKIERMKYLSKDEIIEVDLVR